MSGCPTVSQIEVHLAGSTPDDTLNRHLASCHECRRLTEEIRANRAFLADAAVPLRDAIGRAPEPFPRHAPGTVPGYELLEEIGRGGQGVVYRAVQHATNRPAAVKMLLGGSFASNRQRARFEREIELAARLRHPAIVTVFESGHTAEGRPYVAMEFVSGDQIDTYVRAAWREPTGSRAWIDRVVALMSVVAHGVGHAHTIGVIHRDLKPSNIIVDDQGTPRILDFGLAREITQTPGGPLGLSMTGEFVGTPAFAAPEQLADDDRFATARTDVYSLGLTLYVVLTGRHPYPAEGTLNSIINHALHTEPTPPSRHLPRLPADLETIILKALSKDPQRRYTSANSFAADLDRYLAGHPIDARRDSTWYVLRKSAARHRWALLVAVLALATIASIVYFLMDASSARRRLEEESSRAQAESTRHRAIARVMRSVLPRETVASAYTTGNLDPNYLYGNLRRLEGMLKLGAFADEPEYETELRSALAMVMAQTPVLAGVGELSARWAISGRVAKDGANHPRVAEAYQVLALVLLNRSRLSEARDAVTSAIHIHEQSGAYDPSRLAECHEILSRVRRLMGDTPAAVSHAHLAIELAAASDGRDSLLARCLCTLAQAVATSEDDPQRADIVWQALTAAAEHFDESEPALIETIELAARFATHRPGSLPGSFRTSDPQLLARTLLSLAQGIKADGSNAPYSQRLECLRELRLGLLPPDHPAVGRIHAVLGTQYDIEFKPESALQSFSNALPILRAHLGDRSTAVANCLSYMANSSVSAGDIHQATQWWREGLSILESQPPETQDHVNIAQGYRYLGTFYIYSNQWEAAEQTSRLAEQKLLDLFGPDHHTTAMATAQVALARCCLGDIKNSEPMARRARQVGRNSPATPPDQQEWLDVIHAFTLARSGRSPEAIPMLERFLGQVADNYLGGTDVRSRFIHFYDVLIDSHIALGHDQDASLWIARREEALRRQ